MVPSPRRLTLRSTGRAGARLRLIAHRRGPPVSLIVRRQMDQAERRGLIKDFRSFYEKQSPDSADHSCELTEFWAVMKLDDLAYSEPSVAWSVILELIQDPLPDNAFGCVAAGPLEDLIEYHGAEVIDWVEREAHVNPRFRQLLGGVWKSSTAEVWARVERARGEAW